MHKWIQRTILIAIFGACLAQFGVPANAQTNPCYITDASWNLLWQGDLAPSACRDYAIEITNNLYCPCATCSYYQYPPGWYCMNPTGSGCYCCYCDIVE